MAGRLAGAHARQLGDVVSYDELVAELYLERFGGPPLRPTTIRHETSWRRSENAGTGWRWSGWRQRLMRRGIANRRGAPWLLTRRSGIMAGLPNAAVPASAANGSQFNPEGPT